MKTDFFKTLAALVAAYVTAGNADSSASAEDKTQEAFYAICHHAEIDPVDAQNGRVETLYGKNWVVLGVIIDGCRITGGAK